jgi:MFS family permease
MIIKSHKHINKSFLLIVLSLLISLGPITIYVYLPAFIDIADSFAVATNKVQLTLTFYLIGIVLGQISYGPMIDRYGKKPPLIFGLTLYVVCSLSCYFSRKILSFFLALNLIFTFYAYPFNLSNILISVVRYFLNINTINAKPTATSAAATSIEKNTKI